MSVIGFDIGNESCVIAAAKRGGIDILLNDEAKRETPSVVSFGDKQRFLGSAGAAFASSNPKSTITQIKRLVGRLFNEPSVQEELKLLPFVTGEGPRGGIVIAIEYLNRTWIFTPVEILGMLFTHLKQVAEKNLESPVVDCVIGIPSYFTDLQRREYLDAARIAGLVPLRLIHDGTAIALGYGMYKTDLSKSRPTVVVFVDIGHCDTQVTVAAFEQGGMRVLSHSFYPNLGGRDFDEVLFRHFAAQFKEKYKIDVYSNPRASIRLRASCEKVKKVLSANAEAPISIECLIGDTDVRGLITRDEFERLSMELLERVTYPCIMAVEDSGIDADKIYTIELVGSGSRVPAIMKKLTALFNKEPTRTLNASECVARGCALRCAMLSPSLIVRDYIVQDIFPYSIGIPLDELKNNSHSYFTLFPKGSRIPSYKMIKNTGITKAYFLVSYTNNEVFPAGISHIVGRFSVGSSETSGPEKPRIEITLKLNDYGIVVIDSAIILEDQNFARRTLQSYLENFVGPSQTLNLEFSENLDVATTVGELQEAREREQMLAEQDKKVEETKDQRNTLESFVYDTRSKLSSAYRNFASDPEKKVIADSLQETEDWLYEDSDDDSEQDYTGKLHDLKKLLDPIEKRFKEEKTRIQVKTALQTCAEKYRLYAADSLPPSLKEKILIECGKVERWLNDLSPQQPRLTQIHCIEDAIQTFQRNCKEIIRSKRKALEHDEFVNKNQIDQPMESNQSMNQSVDTEQRDWSVDSDQNSQLVDSDQTSQPADSDQKVQPADLMHKGETVEFPRKDKPADLARKGHLANSSRNDQLTDSDQTVLLERKMMLTSSKLSSAYRKFDTDLANNVITVRVQETEEFEQDHNEKLGNLKKKITLAGFDIGNENCVVVAVKHHNIDVLLNGESKNEMLAVVSFGEKQRFFGSAAVAYAIMNSKSTISQVKRLIGRQYREPGVQEDLRLLPFETSEGLHGGVLIHLKHLNRIWTLTPVQILGMVFAHLKQLTEKNQESPVVDCVIGIPVYFTYEQRCEYLDAACIAGLRPLSLMHDCTAVALFYADYKLSQPKSKPTNVMFVDIGHCDTQVTVVAFEQRQMKILSHSFDQNLGGRDFDEVLFRHFAAQFKEKFKIDIYFNARASSRLRASCEKLKKALSADADATISINRLMGDQDLEGSISRKEFESLSSELLEKVTLPCIKAVEDSGLTVDKINTIELVGSGSRVPAIRRKLGSKFQKEPELKLDDGECVARGCALYSAMLSPSLQDRDYEVQDSLPYTVGICSEESKNNTPPNSVLFQRGSQFPSCKEVIFLRSATFYLNVYFTHESEFPAGISPVGYFMIGPFESSTAAKAEVKVVFHINRNGIIKIESAVLLEDEQSSRNNGDTTRKNLPFYENLYVKTAKVDVREAIEIQHMLAEQDKKAEQTMEKRNILEAFVYDARRKLRGFNSNIVIESEEKIFRILQETEDWLYEEGDDESEQEYTRKLQDLKKLIELAEKKYKDEKAKAEATESLLTLIKEYRVVSDTLPSSFDEEVKYQCVEVENWLNKNSQKNFDSISWSNVIKHAIEVFKGNCEYAMEFKPSV